MGVLMLLAAILKRAACFMRLPGQVRLNPRACVYVQQYVAEIGMKRFDDPYWGPPELMTMRRPIYISEVQGRPSSDLMGSAAAGKCSHQQQTARLFQQGISLLMKRAQWEPLHPFKRCQSVCLV